MIQILVRGLFGCQAVQQFWTNVNYFRLKFQQQL